MLPQADHHSASSWRAQDSTHAIGANPPLSAYLGNFCLPSTMTPSGHNGSGDITGPAAPASACSMGVACGSPVACRRLDVAGAQR